MYKSPKKWIRAYNFHINPRITKQSGFWFINTTHRPHTNPTTKSQKSRTHTHTHIYIYMPYKSHINSIKIPYVWLISTMFSLQAAQVVRVSTTRPQPAARGDYPVAAQRWVSGSNRQRCAPGKERDTFTRKKWWFDGGFLVIKINIAIFSWF